MKIKYLSSIAIPGVNCADGTVCGGSTCGLFFCPEALNMDALAEIKEPFSCYIIAASVCYLNQEWMDEHRIIFLKVGRDISDSRFRPSARWQCTNRAMVSAANKVLLERAAIKKATA